MSFQPWLEAETDLQLYHNFIYRDVLVASLRCFPSLNKFHYDYGDAKVHRGEFLPQRTAEAISNLKSCLGELLLIDMHSPDRSQVNPP